MHKLLVVSLVLLLFPGSGFRVLGSANRPNILLILADDLGYSDLGCYGGEIETPHLDRLAKSGVRFSAFYNSARCCPSRASLMTGLHPHQAGIGSFATAEPRRGGGPAYAGHLLPSCATLAETLGAAGYSTWMVGKWHMGIPGPIERGFQNYYGYRNFLAHSENQWDPDKYVRLPEGTKPELSYERDDFYVTDVFTDYALEFLKQAREKKDRPFFLYLAHSSPHFPVQAPVETIDKYVPTFRKGWDKLREERFERQKELGLVAPDAALPPLSEVPVDRADIANGYPGVPNPHWDSLDADRREDLTRRGATYAAMVEHVDRGVGRILADLEEHGELDDTLILFTSDNGACYEWGPFGFDGPSRQGRTDLYKGADLKKMGQDGTHQSYGSGWANLGNTPLNMYKHFCHEGGIASPLIAHWPKGIARKDAWVHDPAHIMDIVPTVLAATGATYPAERDGTKVTPIEGTSLFDALGGEALPERALAFEHQEARGLRKGDWKIVWGKRQPDPVRWELYNLKLDRSELRDLSKEKPELTAELVAEWEAWAKKVGADPFARDDRGRAGADADWPQLATPQIAGKVIVVQCDVEPESENGVIVAQGGREQGYALHLVDGQLTFDVRVDGTVSRVELDEPIEGRFHATATLEPRRLVLNAKYKTGGVQTFAASRGLIPVQPKDGLNVGFDDLTAAGNYQAPNRFKGKVFSVDVTPKDPEPENPDEHIARSTTRWSAKKANAWYDAIEWPVGANFVPSTAINQLEMWQAETFDPESIDHELGWAAGIGMNTMRVYLHDIPWRQDADGFGKRVDRYLEIAHSHGIRTMFVIFDSVWHPYPKAGKQPEPRPGLHNSGWVQSPGREILEDPKRHDELKPYVQWLLTRYKDDRRVLAWDLFNEPDNAIHNSYGAGGTKEEMPHALKIERATQLLEKTFAWAREANPAQPLTCGVWAGDYLANATPIQRLSLEQSDIISFHSYAGPEETRKLTEGLLQLDRPVFCTEYMARGNNSTFAGILPIFHQHKVAAYNWGLVNGKSQTIYPWDSWKKPYSEEPRPWFHDIFRKDGTPYDAQETRLITRLAKQPRAKQNVPPQGAAPLMFVPFHEVRLDDPVWRPRTAKLVQNTLPHAFKQTEVAQERLRLCAEWLESGGTTPKPAPHRFNTSDLYKVMEGAALMIKAEPNAGIEALMDRIIDVIARAQKDDGYLYVPHITGAIIEGEMGPRPYSYVIHSHELYNVGHLYEAAVAYAQATGKTKLLEVAEKSALHVNRVFFEGDPAYNDGKPVMQAPGHQEIEIGLLKLHHVTGKPLYLKMARRFLAIRGVTFVPDGEGVNSPTYAQQHQPVADQREAVGHAVRAGYQYAAMAEVDSLLGTDAFTAALDGIWHDLVDRKMHITGGLGAVHGIEGFGPPYELPNKDTYLETCAAVANVLFNMRMFLKYGDARFVDVAEVSLLNNALAGVGLDGTSFFYPNPLEADHGHAPRSGWFGTACCPSNIARLIPQVAGYMYAVAGNRVTCALYAQSSTSLTVNGAGVDLRQETAYPYDGEVTLRIDPKSPVAFELALRIPTWAREQFVPGELYSYLGDAPKWSVAVNGETIDATLENGFVTIARAWKAGDRVVLQFPMPVRANTCIDKVEANRGRVAITRGPLVFCAEGIDNDGAVQRFFVNPRKAVEAAMVSRIADGPLQNLPQTVLPAREVTLDGVRDAEITMIPYFAWSNRDRSSMITWLPTTQELAKPDTTSPKHFKFASVSASHTFELDTVDAVRMPHQPRSSADTSIPRWTSWPQRGREQWVEIDLGKGQTIRSVGAYWYDDAGGVQVPGSWHLEVPAGTAWKQVAIYNTDSYSTLKDTYNTVRPAEPLKTDRLRLVMKPQHDQTCVGLLSVQIETNDDQ